MQLKGLLSLLLIIIVTLQIRATLATNPTQATTVTWSSTITLDTSPTTWAVTETGISIIYSGTNRHFICSMAVVPVSYIGNIHLKYNADSPVTVYVLNESITINVNDPDFFSLCGDPMGEITLPLQYVADGMSGDVNLNVKPDYSLLFVYIGSGPTPIVSVTINGQSSTVTLTPLQLFQSTPTSTTNPSYATALYSSTTLSSLQMPQPPESATSQPSISSQLGMVTLLIAAIALVMLFLATRKRKRHDSTEPKMDRADCVRASVRCVGAKLHSSTHYKI